MQKKIRLTFIEELLGTASGNPELHREFIASKSPEASTLEEEVAAIGVDGTVEKAMTVFPRRDGKPFLYDYQIKGFFKDACGSLARAPGTKSNKLKAYRKVVDGLTFVQPREIPLQVLVIGNCQRPLRASTAQGERIALANSETAPAGSALEFVVTLLDDSHDALLEEWLNYGALRGLGQWRNSGKGRFTWKEME